ncbi:hypothetical protein [Effusibacillus consociatus]|uniref:Uncharacterized protein n=1 Tax=Effusibacillus consociatus TaxID=1117041 RepID=A0ABV9PY09_9BACL
MENTNRKNQYQKNQTQPLKMQSTETQAHQMSARQVGKTMTQSLQTRTDEFDPNKEQAVLASFKDPDVAQKASNELQKMGIETVQIDRVSPYPGQPTQELRNPITGKIPGLGELTLGMEPISSQNAGVLMAADPSASGLSGPHVSGEDILMTVVCPKDQVEQVVQVIQSHGGNT